MKEEQKVIPERINMKRYKNFITKSEKDTYKIPLTDMDKESFQSELLLMMQAVEEAEANMKKAVKGMKAHITEIQMKLNRARRALELGYEEREGFKHTIVFMEERRTGIYNDDGQLITDRPMSTSEGQMDIYVESSLMESRQISGASASKVTIERPSILDDEAEEAEVVESKPEPAPRQEQRPRPVIVDEEEEEEEVKVDDPFA